MIKRHQRNNSQFFVNFFFGSILERESSKRREQESKQRKEEGKSKESKGEKGESQINNYNIITLQVITYMSGFLVDIVMHGTCMWFLGYLLSFTCIFFTIDSGFSLALPFLGQS